MPGENRGLFYWLTVTNLNVQLCCKSNTPDSRQRIIRAGPGIIRSPVVAEAYESAASWCVTGRRPVFAPSDERAFPLISSQGGGLADHRPFLFGGPAYVGISAGAAGSGAPAFPDSGSQRRSIRCSVLRLERARNIDALIPACSRSRRSSRIFICLRLSEMSPHAGQAQPITGKPTSATKRTISRSQT